MKKEQIQENGISRRGFLKRTALAGAAICIAPALEKVTAAEKAITGKSSVSAATIPARMVRPRHFILTTNRLLLSIAVS